MIRGKRIATIVTAVIGVIFIITVGVFAISGNRLLDKWYIGLIVAILLSTTATAIIEGNLVAAFLAGISIGCLAASLLALRYGYAQTYFLFVLSPAIGSMICLIPSSERWLHLRIIFLFTLISAVCAAFSLSNYGIIALVVAAVAIIIFGLCARRAQGER